MNFLQTYRRHLIFKLAGIAAVILAVLSSAYLFMSADYARSVRKNTLALNERLTAQTATRIEASWDSLYNITTAFCYSPTVQQYFGKFSEPASGYTGACLGFFQHNPAE